MTWYRVGGGGLPPQIKTDMNNVLNKKMGTSGQTYPPTEWADDVNLMGMLEIKTASGSIASFSDGADGVPVKSCTVSFLPSGGGGTPSAPISVQGVSGLSVTRTGKNMFDKDHANVVTGYIASSNFNTGNSNAKTIYIPIKGGETYTVSKTAGQRFALATSENIPSSGATFTSKQQHNTSASDTITAGNNDKYLWAWVFMQGTDTGTLEDMLASVQIEVGSTATAYTAFVASDTVTDTFGQTLYGGTRDLTTDKASVTYALLNLAVADMNNSDNYPGWKNSGIKALIGSGVNGFVNDAVVSVGSVLSANTTGNNDTTILPKASYGNMTQTDWQTNYPDLVIQIAVPLATPTELTGLTPHEIDTLLGDNNIYADTGTMSVEYRAMGTTNPGTLVTKTISDNGTYDPANDNADGYSQVTVNLPLGTKTITTNDTYNASSDGLKGFSSVTVSVSGGSSFTPTFTETLIGDNSSHASSFTLSEAYTNYGMVKIVWYESSSSSGFLYTTPDILDEIFTVGAGKICINKPSTNMYVCYTKSGLTWTQTNQRTLYVHEVYGVTFTNCSMTATDLYKRGASTTDKYAITSQTSLKNYDMFVMSSIHATDGTETMPTTWLYQYPQENISGAFSCPIPTVLQEYNGNDDAFIITEYGMTAARYFMVQGITFTPTT